MKKNTNLIWLRSDTDWFYRKQGAVRLKPFSVVPRLIIEGMRIEFIIPYDASLLPKTPLTENRTTHFPIPYHIDQTFSLIKLSKGGLNPGIYMLDARHVELPQRHAIYSWAGIALAKKLRKPIDFFHTNGGEFGFLPIFLAQEKSKDAIFENTKTIFSLKSLKRIHPFSSQLLQEFHIPTQIFHPDGVLFMGAGSFIKSGIVFSDQILFYSTGQKDPLKARIVPMWRNILNEYKDKISAWTSDRSFVAYMKVYEKLLSREGQGRSQWRQVMDRVTDHRVRIKAEPPYPELWGPPIPARYHRNQLGFKIQSPQKGYAFWEWAGDPFEDYGIIVDNHTQGDRKLIRRGLPFQCDLWFDLNPLHEYSIELLGWDRKGQAKTLLKSLKKKSPRNNENTSTEFTFKDVRDGRQFHLKNLTPVNVDYDVHDGSSHFNDDDEEKGNKVYL